MGELLAEVFAFAEARLARNQIYSIALVVDGDCEIPGERGLFWLTGFDFFGTPSTPREDRARSAMLGRLSPGAV